MIYKCNRCSWEGDEEQLEYDNVESCMGADKIEMCPKCGSIDLKIVPKA